MTGTLAGALEARSIPTGPDKLFAEVEGYIENVESKPLITRIHVKYHLKVPKGKKTEAQRAVDHHEGTVRLRKVSAAALPSSGKERSRKNKECFKSHSI